MLIRRVRRRSGQAGIRRYAGSVAADNRAVLELLRGSGGLDPSIAQASYGMVEHRSPFRCACRATSR
jgi:hypothetical protein